MPDNVRWKIPFNLAAPTNRVRSANPRRLRGQLSTAFPNWRRLALARSRRPAQAGSFGRRPTGRLGFKSMGAIGECGVRGSALRSTPAPPRLPRRPPRRAERPAWRVSFDGSVGAAFPWEKETEHAVTFAPLRVPTGAHRGRGNALARPARPSSLARPARPVPDRPGLCSDGGLGGPARQCGPAR